MIKWAFIGYNTSITMISWHIMYKITSYDKPKLDDPPYKSKIFTSTTTHASEAKKLNFCRSSRKKNY